MNLLLSCVVLYYSCCQGLIKHLNERLLVENQKKKKGNFGHELFAVLASFEADALLLDDHNANENDDHIDDF
jgi:hypothetical protein